MRDFTINRKLLNRLNAMQANHKAEAVISDLFSQGLDEARLQINHVSSHKKNWEKDILRFDEKAKKLQVSLCRDGIFHSLPEYLFLLPLEGSRSDIEKAIAFNQEQHNRMQVIFNPVDTVLFLQRVGMETHLNRFLGELLTDESAFLSAFWQLDERLDPVDRARLCKVLPMAQQVTGNFQLTAAFLGFVIQEKVSCRHVRIQQVFDEPAPAPSATAASKLGSCECGTNMMTGGASVETIDMLEFTISDISLDRIGAYLPDGKKHKLVHSFFGYFIPYHCEIKIKLLIRAEEASMEMGSAVMGYNSTLN